MLTPVEARSLQAKIAGIRERQRQREEEDRLREAAERAAYLGACYECRDTGITVGTLNTPCDLCARGRAIAAERIMAAARAIYAGANIPPRPYHFTLDSYPSKHIAAYGELLDFLRDWDGRQNLMLCGPWGTGKTGLLVSCLRWVADMYALSGRRILFTTGADLLDELRRGYGDGTFPATLERARTVSLLAIDDLGVEKPTDWVLERLFVILDARYNGHFDGNGKPVMLPTFVTTNYGLEALAERIGPRVMERLLEQCRVIDVDGPNLRAN